MCGTTEGHCDCSAEPMSSARFSTYHRQRPGSDNSQRNHASFVPPRLLCSLRFAISLRQALSETAIREIRSDRHKFPRILTSLMSVLSKTGFEIFFGFFLKGLWQPYWSWHELPSWSLRFSMSVNVLPWKTHWCYVSSSQNSDASLCVHHQQCNHSNKLKSII